jgi:hypothetical protein
MSRIDRMRVGVRADAHHLAANVPRRGDMSRIDRMRVGVRADAQHPYEGS